ncbi:uncharacterized protein LOC130131904 isoform X2 [Lampris incognitus]|uniref:uncharacterized protein LOC130131904 isoform X2 n=1 Tax=Lampris incognitus TaxID=2546036 RepID=UPI0024B5CF01|nr:uncharacterized protein LOC130131904 isoform X2 [Lampris incognitus]
MTVVLKRSTEDRRSRSTDRHLGEGYLLQVKWNNNHNHLLISADALRKRDVSKETVERLSDLFQQGQSPSSALDTIKYDLQEEKGDDYFLVAADRSIVPDPGFCYRLYYKIFAKAYGVPSGEGMAVDLQKRLDAINQEHGGRCAQMEVKDGQLIVAICTPVMQRVHAAVQQSGELVFVDSSGNCDRENHRIFLLMTHCAVGGVPLGVLITTSENTPTLQAGFTLLKGLLPPDGFFGRGMEGPQTIMTDDCAALRQSLHATFPTSRLLLCTFHLLQAMWRWLLDSHNKIVKEDRPQLLTEFRRLVYVSTEGELSAAYAELNNGILAKKYPNFLKHVAKVYGRREEWALCLRTHLVTHGNNTNNYVESAMKVIKDNVLHRLKAYNLSQLVDFMVTRFEDYYIRRLTDFANNRVVRRQPRPSTSDVDCQRITREDDTNFTVPSGSGTTWYHVNTSLSVCTCAVGVTGANCKHQNAVVCTFNVNEAIPATSTPQLRRMFHEIASGRPTPEHWFESLAFQTPVMEHLGDGDSAGTAPTLSGEPPSHQDEASR